MERKNLLRNASNFKTKRPKELKTYDDFVEAIRGYVPCENVFTKERFFECGLVAPNISQLPYTMGLTHFETMLTNGGYKFCFQKIARWYQTLFCDKRIFVPSNPVEKYCYKTVVKQSWFDNDFEWNKAGNRGSCWGFIKGFCQKIFPDEKLSNLFQKTLFQQLLVNLGYLDGGSDFVPILQGRQGTGKSRFIAALQPLPPLFLGEVSAANLTVKDSLIELTSHAAVELAEIETTLGRNSCGLVKAFLTRGEDQFRQPYAAAAKTYTRHCAFWGTTNSKEFLQDQTGNRRFIVFPFNFDAKQRERVVDFVLNNKEELWAAIFYLIRTTDDIEKLGWRLTANELAENERQNEGYKKQPRGTVELLDIIEEGPTNWQGTASELKEMFPATLGNLSLNVIGSRLKEIPGVEYKKTAGPRLYKLCLRKLAEIERKNKEQKRQPRGMAELLDIIEEGPANWQGTASELKEMFPSALKNLTITTIGTRLKEIPGVEFSRTNKSRLYKLCLRKFVDHEEQHFRAVVDNCKNCLMQFIVPTSENKANWCGKNEDLERILDGFSEEHFDSYVLSHAIRLLKKENVIEEHPDGWKIYLSFKPSFLPSIRFGSVNPEVM